MATAVFFHAHPDDECILTGGTMAKLASAGHRVVLVTATRGENGEVAEGFLGQGESLAERRMLELEASAAVLGVSRLEVLGYGDSGMMGTPTNDVPASFWRADIEEAARRLATILDEESATVLVTYDDHGNYGHPDHIQVHRVGVRAAELAGTAAVYEATVDRDRVIRMISEGGGPAEGGPEIDEMDDFGVPASMVTTRVDVGEHVAAKRQAMRCHPSQITADSFWLTMPDEQFTVAFSEEQYIRRGSAPGTLESALDLG